MISSIRLGSFKAFDTLEVDLAPITVLLGPNSSGKSSIIAPLRMLVQTLESYDSQVPLLLNGSMGDFGSFGDVVYSGRGRRRRLMHIGISVPSTRHDGDESSSGYWQDLVDRQQVQLDLKYQYRLQRREVTLSSTKIALGDQPLLETRYSDDTERQIVDKVGTRKVPSYLKGSFSQRLRFRNFLPRYITMPRRSDTESSLGSFVDELVESELVSVSRASRAVERGIRRIEYVGAMRQPPTRTYVHSGERHRRVGPRGEYAANLLTMDSFRRGRRSRGISAHVRDWMLRAGIGSDIDVRSLTDRHYEIRMQHPVTQEYQNLADVGQGNSQVLPVLVGGYNLDPGSTYVVEEPEIHLHPRAQAELGEFVMELYDNRVQSIIETHSEALVLRLQQHVAAGRIPPSQIAFYYVYAEKESQGKIVKPMDLNDDGLFVEDWPEGFFPESLHEAEQLTLIRMAKRTGR